MAKIVPAKNSGLRRVAGGEWDDGCEGRAYAISALAAYPDVPVPPAKVVKLTVGYGELCGLDVAGKTIAMLENNVWRSMKDITKAKPVKRAPSSRKWEPGYYRVDRVGGRAACGGPGDRDWWYCRVFDAPAFWGTYTLFGYDREGRPHQYISTPTAVTCRDGSGEAYLDKMAGSKYFTVKLVKPGNKIARAWPVALRQT